MTLIDGGNRETGGGGGKRRNTRKPEAIYDLFEQNLAASGQLIVFSISKEEWENEGSSLPMISNFSGAVGAISGSNEFGEIPCYLEIQRLDEEQEKLGLDAKDLYCLVIDTSGNGVEIHEWHHLGGSNARIVPTDTGEQSIEEWAKTRNPATAIIPISDLDQSNRNVVESTMGRLHVDLKGNISLKTGNDHGDR